MHGQVLFKYFALFLIFFDFWSKSACRVGRQAIYIVAMCRIYLVDETVFNNNGFEGKGLDRGFSLYNGHLD